MLDIAIRPGRPSDLAFVHNTFRNSFHSIVCTCCVDPRRQGQDPRVNRHRDLLTRALERHPLHVAVHPEDDNEIVGWLLGEGHAVVYAYTRHLFRRQRVLFRLMERAGVKQAVACLWPTVAGMKVAQRLGIHVLEGETP